MFNKAKNSIFQTILWTTLLINPAECCARTLTLYLLDSGLFGDRQGASMAAPEECDIELTFLKSRSNDGILFTRPGVMSEIRLMAKNIGRSHCPGLMLKLFRYKGRQGWVEGGQTALIALAPGHSTVLNWLVNPEQQGFYTYKPQFVGGLIDADLTNHSPEKKFKAVFHPEE